MNIFSQSKSSVKQFKPIIYFLPLVETRWAFYYLSPSDCFYVLEEPIQAIFRSLFSSLNHPSPLNPSFLQDPLKGDHLLREKSCSPSGMIKNTGLWMVECSLELPFLDTAFAFPSSYEDRREQQKSVCLAASYRIHMCGAQHAALSLHGMSALPWAPCPACLLLPIFLCAVSLLWGFDGKLQKIIHMINVYICVCVFKEKVIASDRNALKSYNVESGGVSLSFVLVHRDFIRIFYCQFLDIFVSLDPEAIVAASRSYHIFILHCICRE